MRLKEKIQWCGWLQQEFLPLELKDGPINFGLSIPVKEGKEFVQSPTSHLQCHQTQWRHVKLLILDEKSMVGRAQMGHCDRCLRQAFPENAGDSLGGIPAIFFGDFAQLPPIGDTPLYVNNSEQNIYIFFFFKIRLLLVGLLGLCRASLIYRYSMCL